MDGDEILVPVPLHPARQRQRRFNQAEEIAHHLARVLNLPVCSELRRIQQTLPQKSLTARQRKQNLAGAFATHRPDHIARKRIILVDDVVTTGATAAVISRLLLARGAEDVIVAALARTPAGPAQ